MHLNFKSLLIYWFEFDQNLKIFVITGILHRFFSTFLAFRNRIFSIITPRLRYINLEENK
jgi:hypothetical protein